MDDPRASQTTTSSATADAARRHVRISALFVEALDLDETQRAGWLAEQCGSDGDLRAEVEGLLRRDASAAAVDVPVVEPGPLAAALGAKTGTGMVARGAAFPDRIGQYEILGLLGRGGMGTVYRARQRHPERVVALKVMTGGWWSEALLRRFEFEVQYQAKLQHPGIAQVYEAGTAELGGVSIPYFAMELVEGPRLTEYAAREQLSVRERIELLVHVCDAVQHAHQRGVIHRDLKPGNILVGGAGQPKVLDFGVARLAECEPGGMTAHTSTGELVGTLPYMSPEQVLGKPDEIDTRSDVYALGVIAYELLTGRVPIDVTGAMPGAVQRICEQEPTRLGTLQRAFRGDLETIVGKALEKDRERRYASVAGLAGDLQRYLRSEPILARPASFATQLAKFARRNRALVTGAGLAFAALLLGVIGTTYGLVRARAERDDAIAARQAERGAREVAEQQVSIAKATNQLLVRMFESADPLGDTPGSGPELTVRAMLEREGARLDRAFDDHPLVEASVRNTVGIAFKNLARYDEAERHLRRALALFEANAGADPAAVARAERELGSLLVHKGQLEEGICLFESGYARQRAASGDADSATALAAGRLAWAFLQDGRPAPAEAYLLPSIRVLEQSSEPEAYDGLIGAYNNLARVRRMQGQNDDALRWYDESAQLIRARYGDRYPTMAAVDSNSALILTERGEFAEAERRYRRALEVRVAAYGAEHPLVGDIYNNLAGLLADQQRIAEAIESQEMALRIQQRALSANHPDCLLSRANLAVMLGEANRWGESGEVWKGLVESYRSVFGPEHWRTEYGRCAYARTLSESGRTAEAEQIVPAAWDRLAAKRPLPNGHTRGAAWALIRLYEQTGRTAEADAWREKANLKRAAKK